MRNSLTALMWRQVGIRRDETGLRQAAEQVEFLGPLRRQPRSSPVAGLGAAEHAAGGAADDCLGARADRKPAACIFAAIFRCLRRRWRDNT